MKYVCEKRFKSDLKTARHIIDEILYNIDSKIDEDIYFDVRLILNELVSNCVLHGNKKDEAKQVNLFFSFDERKIKIVVSDEGKGIKFWKKCNPNPFTIINPLPFSSKGLGLIIVKGLSDKFYINGNTVTVQKSIS